MTELWVDPVEGGVTAEVLQEFLRSQGMTDAVEVYDGPDVPPSDPGAMIVATWLPGAGFQLEQMLDTPGVQLRVIGPQGNHDAARVLAVTVDAVLVAVRGIRLGGRYVVEVRRAGGRPSLDRVDDADRAHYVCTYLVDLEADRRG